MQTQKLRYRSNTCLWCCTPSQTSLSGYLIKAAEPQSSTERQGLEGEEAGEEWWKTQITERVSGCSQECPRESLSPSVQARKTSSWVNTTTAFDWGGWLPRRRGTHHGVQRKSQPSNLCITVLSKSNPNMTLQFDSLAIRTGEMSMKIAASDELTARTFTVSL